MEKIQALPTKKASGPDSILNEMLKNTNHKFQLAIIKLFNLVLSVGHFPEASNRGLITPYSRVETNQTQTITEASVWAVIWGSCSAASSTPDLYTSLQTTMSSAKVKLDSYQIIEQQTTSSPYTPWSTNILTKIFACFVDFQKAFDSIWHEGLLSKLIESGIGGKTYNIIKTMYSNNQCAIKIGNKLTEFFTQGRGVRQGCPLSPTLFNIYINELAKVLEQSSAPGLTLHDSNIKFLLFADLSNRRGSTAEPRHLTQVLSDLGPDY